MRNAWFYWVQRSLDGLRQSFMLGVFSRLAESEKEKQNADEVIWVDEGSEACCQ